MISNFFKNNIKKLLKGMFVFCVGTALFGPIGGIVAVALMPAVKRKLNPKAQQKTSQISKKTKQKLQGNNQKVEKKSENITAMNEKAADIGDQLKNTELSEEHLKESANKSAQKDREINL